MPYGPFDRETRSDYIAGMAIRDIISIPDKRLRVVSEPVAKITPEVRALAEDMFETMYDAPGIGLAAIQVAVPLRLITMDLSKKEGENAPRVFINPEITWTLRADWQEEHRYGSVRLDHLGFRPERRDRGRAGQDAARRGSRRRLA